MLKVNLSDEAKTRRLNTSLESIMIIDRYSNVRTKAHFKLIKNIDNRGNVNVFAFY